MSGPQNNGTVLTAAFSRMDYERLQRRRLAYTYAHGNERLVLVLRKVMASNVHIFALYYICNVSRA